MKSTVSGCLLRLVSMLNGSNPRGTINARVHHLLPDNVQPRINLRANDGHYALVRTLYETLCRKTTYRKAISSFCLTFEATTFPGNRNSIKIQYKYDIKYGPIIM